MKRLSKARIDPRADAIDGSKFKKVAIERRELSDPLEK
jgi:hypothetical protein